MIAVIFEVLPAEGKSTEYLDIASQLRPELDRIQGFISIERFQSMTVQGKILSLSFWENEESVIQWRNVELHRHAQEAGRKSIFSDYRLRVAHVLRDYGMQARAEVPIDSKQIHDN